MTEPFSAPGYSLYALPECLGELACSGSPGQNSDGCTLISADDKAVVWRQNLSDDPPAIVKVYHHRTAVDWWREKCFRFRVQREFEALFHLERSGIPCTRPLFWSCGCNREYGRYEVLATREIPDAERLVVFIRSNGQPQAEKTLASLFRTVRRMHESGLHHGSLYLRNVLVTQNAGDDPNVHVLDMPKAIVYPFSIVGTRMAWIDLMDLSRGIKEKIGTDWCGSALGHYGLNKMPEPEFVGHVKKYHPSKLARNTHRAECEIRELLAKLTKQKNSLRPADYGAEDRRDRQRTTVY